MSACEQCWEQASQDVMLLGGSVVERYQRLVVEATHHVPAGERQEHTEEEK